MTSIGVWMIIIVLLLVLEFIKMELYGACIAIGSLGAAIASIFGLNIGFQILIAVVISMLLIVFVRPIGMKYVSRMKKETMRQKMVGADAIVSRKIDNAEGTGMVIINGTEWAAKSHRPNAVIQPGTLTKVVAMNRDVAIVDDRVRNRHS